MRRTNFIPLMTTEDKFIKQISAIRDTKWEELFAYIVDFERTNDFGRWTKSKQLAKGIFTIPYCLLTPLVTEFISHCYTIGLVLSFDWMHWKEGKEMLSNPANDFDLLDKLTLCKLITLIIRKDRFTEGYLLSCFEDGLMVKILKSLERKVMV
ncbi:MAG: DUF6508 domain-containing protein [Bacteroidales bacterium]|nr:DUF6508 domain-containing protein [Bacteroidales bacterium]